MIRRLVSFIGTARPRPQPATAVLMPTTRDDESASAPPELPGLSAASVWMTSSTTRAVRPSRVGSDRPSPLTTPAVTEPARPSGLPTATTSWPTRRALGVAEDGRLGGRRPGAQHGEVGQRVGADDVDVGLGAVGEHGPPGAGPGHDVRVGEQQAVAGEDDRRTGAAAAVVAGHLQGGDVRGEVLGDGGDDAGVGVERRLGVGFLRHGAAPGITQLHRTVNAVGGPVGGDHALGEHRPCRARALPRYWADDRRRTPLTSSAAGAAGAWEALRPRLAADAEAALGPAEADAFLARVEVSLDDVHGPLTLLYGGGDPAVVDELFERGLRMALAAAAERPEALRRLDRRREIDPGWFQRPGMQGYVCYVDQFCGSLAQLPDRLDYLAELGTTYLHLMPLLQPRPGENDGGYAVHGLPRRRPPARHDGRPRDVAGALHERGMSLCIDLVLNHTAREHAWAQGWLAGDPAYAGFYTAFPDRQMPDAYDATHPRGVPRPGARLLHLGARGLRRFRRLGVDDVLALPVGPRLHEPRGHAGDAR